MTKFLKYVGIIIGVIILLLVIAMVVLVTFVSPNRFKPMLVEQVQKNTGRELIVDGDLSWTFFPYLGLKAGHMSLGNPQGFKEKTFAEFSSATVGVKVFPLLHGRVESSGIALHGMTLNLVKNASGQTNWVFQSNKKSSTEAAPEKPSSNNLGKASLGLAISSIDVSDANVFWRDEQSNQNAAITHFDFHASNINLTKAFPISAAFDFESKSSSVSGHASFTSDVAFSLDKQLYSLRDMDFTATVNQKDKKITAHVTGDLIADLVQETLQWQNFKANVGNLDLTGKVSVNHLTTTPVATGNLQMSPFDLKTFLQSIGQDNASLQKAKDVKGNFDFTASSKSTVATGLVQIDEVQAAKLKLTNVNAHVRFQDGVVELSPVTANLYQGNLNVQSKVNLKTAVPQIQAQGKLTNVQSEPLVADLVGHEQKFKLTGAANADMQITTAGKDANAITKNLNGTARFTFSNGTVEGIDIGYWIDSAYAMAKQQQSGANNTNSTNFGNLTATAVITNGVITNNDLVMTSPRFDTSGKGTIDLVNKNINYSLQAKVKSGQNNTIHGVSGLVIPILIKGNLDSPSIRLDTGELLKSVAQDQIEKHKEQIQQKVQEKVQEQAGKLLQNFLSR